MDTPITIRELAIHRGAQEDENGINGAEFDRVGLAIMGGCGGCHATLAAYNAFPSKSGWWMCKDCIGDDGYQSVVIANADIFGEVRVVD